MIIIEDLSVAYEKEKPILNGFSLHVPKGSVYALVGSSGCGKTTVLKILAGILKNYTGEAFINGKKINPKETRIGYVPQNYGLLEWQNVYNNCVLGLKIKNIKSYSMNEIFEKLELKELLKRYPNQLSGGQRQRVALARSFLMEPEILLMDEPFSALDAITRVEMQNLFNDIWRMHKVTTLFVTHSIEEAINIAEYIGIMSSKTGRVEVEVQNPLFELKEKQDDARYYEFIKLLREHISSYK